MSINSNGELALALLPISEGLDSDGYSVSARWIADAVEVKVDATESACKDCLIPKEAMQQMAQSLLSAAGIIAAQGQIVVIYPDGSAAH